MAFTYNLSTDVGKVRLEIGDTVDSSTVAGAGVKPSGDNFSDEEVQYFLTQEGSKMKAVAAAAETLSRQWAVAANISLGSRSESFGEVSARWALIAADLRRTWGASPRADGDPLAFVVEFRRADAYGNAPADGDLTTTE